MFFSILKFKNNLNNLMHLKLYFLFIKGLTILFRVLALRGIEKCDNGIKSKFVSYQINRLHNSLKLKTKSVASFINISFAHLTLMSFNSMKWTEAGV